MLLDSNILEASSILNVVQIFIWKPCDSSALVFGAFPLKSHRVCFYWTSPFTQKISNPSSFFTVKVITSSSCWLTGPWRHLSPRPAQPHVISSLAAIRHWSGARSFPYGAGVCTAQLYAQHFVFASTLCRDTFASSRWWIYAANITPGEAATESQPYCMKNFLVAKWNSYT